MLKPGEAAARLGVRPETLTTWVNAGNLDYIRTPGGQRRYPEDAVLALLDLMSAEAAS
jgi:excisionase family DNA binding protein